jgi:isochorismate hydrolase
MASFAKKLLSWSTDGKAIKVVATATAGTLIHTGPTVTSTLQEIWLWAQNNHTADVVLTLEWGDAVTDNNIIKTITFKSGEQMIIPGFIIKWNATPLTIKAFAATANVIMIQWFINEIA